jgi:hypothetical protein
MARSPFTAGLAPVTVPETALPEGSALPPFVTDPVHESPTFAVFELRPVLTITSIDVPDGTDSLATLEVPLPLPLDWANCPSSRHPDRATTETSATIEITFE